MAYTSFVLLPILIAQIAISVVLILGGRAMMNLRSYGLAMTAAILALVPCSPIWLFSLPIGIWALWVLNRPDVRAAFGRPAAPAQSRNGLFTVLVVLGGIAVVFVGLVLSGALSWTTLRREPLPKPPGPRTSVGHTVTPESPMDAGRVISSQIFEGEYEHETPLVALAFHPSGDAVASVGEDGRALFWNAETGEQIHRKDNVGALAYSPDGRWLAVGDRDGKSVELFDASNHKTMLDQFDGGPAMPFEQIAFNPDGNRIAALSRAETSTLVQVWHTTDDQRTQWFDEKGSQSFFWCAFRDARNLLLVDEKGNEWIWDTLNENQRLQRRDRGISMDRVHFEGGYTVTAMAYYGGGNIVGRFYAGLDLGRIFCKYSNRSGFRPAHSAPVRALASEGLTLASGDDEGVIKVWYDSPTNGLEERHVLEGHQGPVTALAWGPNRRLLASGGADRTVRLWQVR